MLSLLDEAMEAGARQSKACEVLGLDERTIQRWRAEPEREDARRGPLTPPAHALDAHERARLIDVATCQEFCDLPPAQIVARLADRGEYLASESTFYRVLHEHDLAAPRGPAKPRQPRVRPEHAASGPNQVWVWDITYLKTQIAGRFYYLYLFEDLYSRKIVGFEVHECESMEHSSRLLEATVRGEEVGAQELVVHSDNGAPMKGATMLATMTRLGVTKSFSRPAVSNDNAFCEAVFRTLKYRAWYPRGGFESVEQARDWVGGFVRWYNQEHRHSKIGYVTPEQRHRGEDVVLLERRREVYAKARQRHPERWKGRSSRAWKRPGAVRLSPVRESQREKEASVRRQAAESRLPDLPRA